MAQDNSQTIEATIEVVQREADSYLGKLEKQLEEARGQRLTEPYQKQLEGELESARKMYGGILDEKKKQLEQARASEALALEQTTKEMEANAGRVKENMKAQMMSAWIQSGGDPDVF